MPHGRGEGALPRQRTWCRAPGTSGSCQRKLFELRLLIRAMSVKLITTLVTMAPSSSRWSSCGLEWRKCEVDEGEGGGEGAEMSVHSVLECRLVSIGELVTGKCRDNS